MDDNIGNMTSKDLKIMYKTLNKLIYMYVGQYVYLMEAADNNTLDELQKRVSFYRNLWLSLINELIVRNEI
jgi:hypothetical protein